jgi:KDO2-lipid IV(A) lauroyltransferase
MTNVRHRLEDALVAGAIAGVRLLPWPLIDGIGSTVGYLACAVDGKHRRVASQNIAASLPGRPPREHRRIMRAAFAHFGRLLFALLRFSTLSPRAILERTEVEGEERVRSAYAQGKGVLFVTGHFGYWELQALVHGLRFPPMTVLARPLDNPLLNARLERIRTRTGNGVLYRTGVVRRVMRLLQAGQGVGILIDQHILTKDAIVVDFFGRPAATTSAVAALALRTGAVIVPLFALPLGGGRYRMVYEHPVEMPAPDAADPVRELTQRCTDVLEMYVRRRPELWLWMHRRWREG